MSIAYDTAPPKGPRRVASAPSSLLHRIEKTPLAERLGASTSTRDDSGQSSLVLFFPSLPMCPDEWLCIENGRRDPFVRNAGEVVEEGVGLHLGPLRSRRRRKILTRNWICSWETDLKRVWLLLLLPQPLTRAEMLKWLKFAQKFAVLSIGSLLLLFYDYLYMCFVFEIYYVCAVLSLISIHDPPPCSSTCLHYLVTAITAFTASIANPSILALTMSFKKQSTFPAAPTTARGVSTKLSASKDKVVYTNGKTVIVCQTSLPFVSMLNLDAGN